MHCANLLKRHLFATCQKWLRPIIKVLLQQFATYIWKCNVLFDLIVCTFTKVIVNMKCVVNSAVYRSSLNPAKEPPACQFMNVQIECWTTDFHIFIGKLFYCSEIFRTKFKFIEFAAAHLKLGGIHRRNNRTASARVAVYVRFTFVCVFHINHGTSFRYRFGYQILKLSG